MNIASIGGLAACPMIASYGASKAAVISLTKTSGVELAPAGIRVNAILPGTIFSEMMPRDGEFTESTIAKIPMGRGGEPGEIGTAAVFLGGIEMTKQETYDYLTNCGINYEITEHEAVFNMEELKAIELPYPDADAKNLFVRDDKKRNYYLITVKGDKRVDLKQFQKDHGTKRLSFASAEDLMRIMKLIPGAVTPLGLLNDEERKVTLFLDADFGGGLVGVHPNDNTATVWLAAADLVRVIGEHGNKVDVVEIG